MSEIARLKNALQQAEASSQAKTAILANIAHELRTPLNAIIGFSRLLERHTQLSGEQRGYINLILSGGEHMIELIEDILNMTSIEAGLAQLNPSEFDFYSLIEDSAAIYTAAASEKGLGFQLELLETTPRFIIADRTKIRQILSNFLSNALKFTNKGMIRLSIKAQENVDNPDVMILTLTVSDTGMGIKPEESDKIFEPYQQTSSGLQSHEGNGLGLAITRQFVELMNGNITVQSRWQEGTSFICDLQVAVPSKMQETEHRITPVNKLLETKEHREVQLEIDIDELSPELQHSLKLAAKNYSLEQIKSVINDFPDNSNAISDFILAKANEFDFRAILDLFSS